MIITAWPNNNTYYSHAQRVRLLLNWVSLALFALVFTKPWVTMHRTRPNMLVKKSKKTRIYGYRAQHAKKYLNTFTSHRYIKPDPINSKPVKTALLLQRDSQPIFKSLFHFRLIMNWKEFYVYDYYNFYSTVFTRTADIRPTRFRQPCSMKWRKINFFYHMRRSLDICLRHTLGFWGYRRSTYAQRRSFVLILRPASVLGYLWLFEFNVLMFLVKSGFCASLAQARTLLATGTVFINSTECVNPWHTLAPANILQLVVSKNVLLRFNINLQNLFGFLRKLRSYYWSFYLRSSKKSRLRRKVNLRGIFKLAKMRHIRFIEVDYRSMSAILLPVKTNLLYYQYIYAVWLNYWNYRSLGWHLLT